MLLRLPSMRSDRPTLRVLVVLGALALASFYLQRPTGSAAIADDTTLVIPTITKPAAEQFPDDPLQADYDKMWLEYETAITNARKTIATTLESQLAKAMENGDLESVEFWEGFQKRFQDESKFTWDISPKAPVEWKKRHPTAPFPREMHDAVRTATEIVEGAQKKLETSYADIVKAYTRARKLDRAKELREEGVAIMSGRAPEKKSPELAAQPSAPASAGKPEVRPPTRAPTPSSREQVRPPAGEKGSETVGRVPMQIPADAMKFGGHAYFCFSGHPHIDQPSAIAKCRDLGGYLARIETQQEWDAVKDMIADRGKKGLLTATHWIDGSDTRQEGVWSFSDGTPMHFFAWNPGEPNGGLAENGIQVENNGVWNDNALSRQLGFICEWEIGPGERNTQIDPPPAPAIDPRAAAAQPVARRPVEDLRLYPFVGAHEANSTEAQEMLRWLGATDIVVEPGGGCIRGQLRPDQEVRLWPNTYGKPMCYGIRTKDPSGPPGQHEPYFEVCRPSVAR